MVLAPLFIRVNKSIYKWTVKSKYNGETTSLTETKIKVFPVKNKKEKK